MLKLHSQILLDAEDKAACPPLVDVGCHSHNKLCHAIQHRCIRVSSKSTRTGMYVFLVDLTLRVGIH